MKNYIYVINKNVHLKRLLFITTITAVSFIIQLLAKLAIMRIDIPLSYPYNSVILTGLFYLLQLGIGLFFLYLGQVKLIMI